MRSHQGVRSVASSRAPSTRAMVVLFPSCGSGDPIPPLTAALIATRRDVDKLRRERVMIPLSAFMHTATCRFPVVLSDHVGCMGPKPPFRMHMPDDITTSDALAGVRRRRRRARHVQTGAALDHALATPPAPVDIGHLRVRHAAVHRSRSAIRSARPSLPRQRRHREEPCPPAKNFHANL